MIKKIHTTQPTLILSVVLLFSLLFFLQYSSDSLQTSDYVLLSLLFFTIIVSLMTKMVYGLILSVLIIFSYISLVFYESVIYGNAHINPNYIWIVAFPLFASVFGYMGDVMHETSGYVGKINMNNDAIVTIDSRSGLGNIKSFYSNLSSEIARSTRHKYPLSIMIIEIQEIEELLSLYGKDNYGNIIQIITKAITKASRLEDFRYSISQKAFAIIMPMTNEEGSKVVKNRIKELLFEINIIEEKIIQTYKFDVRIGVKQYDNSIKDEFDYKKKTEKEVEFDV